jgi:hypothetical protein
MSFNDVFANSCQPAAASRLCHHAAGSLYHVAQADDCLQLHALHFFQPACPSIPWLTPNTVFIYSISGNRPCAGLTCGMVKRYISVYITGLVLFSSRIRSCASPPSPACLAALFSLPPLLPPLPAKWWCQLRPA